MITGKKILITGGAGAIGSNLCRRLLETDNYILVVDDLSSGYQNNLPIDDKLQFIRSSILETNCYQRIVSFKPNIIFHLAAFFANQNSVDHPNTDLNVNIQGTLLMLQMATEVQADKFIYGSSSCVYGIQESQILTETLPITHLDTPYAISKYSAEFYCKFWYEYYEVPIVILRLFNSFGPGEYPGQYRNVIPNFFYKALNKESLPITGTGNETRDFNYVENAIDVMTLVSRNDISVGKTYNVASGVETSIKDLAEKINMLTNNKAGITYGDRRKWDNIKKRRADISMLKADFNYTAKIALDEGLSRTYEWFIKEGIWK